MRTPRFVLAVAASFVCAHSASAELDTFDYDSLTLEEPALEFDLRIQTRYVFNKRDADGTTLATRDDDITHGFVLRRTNLKVTGRVTDKISSVIQVGFRRGQGDANLERAHLTMELTDDVSLDIGMIRPKIIREEHTSASRQLGVERSAGNETRNQGNTEGIELAFKQDRWRAFFALTDGFGNNNTLINSAAELDFSLSARIELRFGEASWRAYRQFTSFRGANNGIMLGAAVAYEFGSDTNPSTPLDTSITTLVLDVSVVRDGWNAYASAVMNHTDTDGVPNTSDLILLIQGGYFVTNHDELFTRFNAVLPDKDNAPLDEDFHIVSFGWNHYVIPESHAAKFTLELLVALDPTTTSIVRTSDGHNLFPDSDSGQTTLVAQMQILF